MQKLINKEIEARFIVSINPEEKELPQIRRMNIDQRYLRGKGRIRRVQTRLIGKDTETTSVVLNRKWEMAKTLGGNWEMEFQLPNAFFFARFCFWFLTKFFSDPTCYPVYKIRTVYEWTDGLELEWDVFASQYALPDGPFGILEVEVGENFDIATLKDKLPKWFVVAEDITGKSYWRNASISRRLQRIYHGKQC